MFLGLVYIWAAGDYCNCEILESALFPDENSNSTVLWSKEERIDELPFYQVGSTFAPYQPVIPASYQSEMDFVQNFQ